MMNNLRKIDASLLYKVNELSKSEDSLKCILYTNSFIKTKQYILRTKCCEVEKEYPFISALGVKIKANNLVNFCSFKHLEYITSNAQVFTQICTAKKVCNLKKLTDEGLTGKGVTVAVIDTGVFSHLDFVYPRNRIIIFKDFIQDKALPYDDNGHGTFITSILGGNGIVKGKKFSGIAPNVNIISLKALDKKGETGAFNILEAMQWVYDHKDEYNIKVVCMSFGSNPLGNTDPLKVGAETLWNNGITVVAAAGNSGPDRATIKSPGVSSKIITVGAMDDHRNENEEYDEKTFEVADFSSRGPAFRYYKPDLITSGVNLVGASNKGIEHYTTMSGTSVATPIIAGVCALLVEKYKNITPTQIKSYLLSNTIHLTGDNNKEGYGYLYIK